MNKLKSNWKASLTFFCLLLLVLSLGVWQIDRGYKKKELENTFLERQSQPVKEIKYNTFENSDLYRNVVLEGKYLDQIFLLDNKIHNGKPGLKVFSPFESINESLVLVSRGWIEFEDRSNLPMIKTERNALKIQGILRSESKDFILENDNMKKNTNPILVQTINLDELSNYLGKPLSPYILELSELSKSAFVKTWQPINLSSFRHFGYAVQWFGLGLVLIIGYLFFLRKEGTKENE
ncbi:MAG: SURF1 family protein [Gammaproteobacteria bacterium]|jgi:surfeit locus 1 family protein|tara:strand:- start:478 stop:1185 length:708 start_codon:yes stop_codon:yes gene_type:complete